jgi:pyridoxine 5'-phosphate synthase PdxJ
LFNLAAFFRIEEVAEVSIGHALIADAMERGVYATLHSYADILQPTS